jgi:LacI family transcriptional regulator
LAACTDDPLDVVVYDHESAAEATSPLLGSLPATGRLDGLLIMGIPLQDSMAERLHQRQLPTVLVDSFHPSLPSVNVDDERGGRLIAEHLISQGHRTFAYVSERQQSQRFVSQAQRRINGVTAAMADAGIDPSALQRVFASHDVAGGRAAAADLLTQDSLPDAVVGHFDEIAAGLLLGLHAAGLRTPDDVAVVGYDDGALAQALDLTTIRQPLTETGRAGAEILLEAISSGRLGANHLLLSPELVVRSTA